MLGSIEVLEQREMTSMPQAAASAWGAMSGLVGANYKPMAYVGTQVVKGVNHVFLAEQTMMTVHFDRHIVIVTINEFDGKYCLTNIERVI